ncbi:MAG: hypothetical protein OES79_10675, partial [Planctomycetota bacterium]|nr:hypothetical protein [Planctomycetota bacterium]
WLPRVPDGAPTYFVQRCLFRIATWTDPPLAALTVLGLAIFFAAIVKQENRHRAGMNAESGP